jgi:16S rRNA U1498 N3-methylase RsmE
MGFGLFWAAKGTPSAFFVENLLGQIQRTSIIYYLSRLMHYFFVPDLSAQEVLLPEEEAQHCAKVLRMRPGTAVILIDGAGTRCQAELLVVDKKQVLAGIRQRETQVGHRNYSLHMVVAPTKNIARFEWFLEKATELGVDRITPALCEHSERNRIRHDRLEKVGPGSGKAIPTSVFAPIR